MESQNKPERGNALWKATFCTPMRTNLQEKLENKPAGKGLWCGCWELSTNCFIPATADTVPISCIEG